MPLGDIDRLDWSSIDGYRFQELCIDLLSFEGYDVQDQGIGPDGGVDAILLQSVRLPDDTSKQLRWAAQFKLKKSADSTVKPKELGNVSNILARFRAEGFFLVTNGRITNKTMLEIRGVLGASHPEYLISVWSRRHIEKRIRARREIAARYFPSLGVEVQPVVTVEITLDLPFEEFSERDQRLLRHALASFLEVPTVSIKIREILRGSTRILVDLPPDAAQLLQEAFEGDYLRLDDYGFSHAIVYVRQAEALGETGFYGPRLSFTSEVTRPFHEQVNQILGQFYQQVLQMARRQLRGFLLEDQYEPEELVHDAFIRLAARSHARSEHISEGLFLAVLSRTLRHTLIDRSRFHMASRRGGRLEDLRDSLIDTVIDTSSKAIENELLVDLHKALDLLHESDPSSAALVELRYFAGMDWNELAEKNGVSPMTLKFQMRSAIKKLRRSLDE